MRAFAIGCFFFLFFVALVGIFPTQAQTSTPTPLPTSVPASEPAQRYTLESGQVTEIRFTMSAGEILIASLLAVQIIIQAGIFIQARIDHER